MRKNFAKTSEAKALGYKAGDFSYNTGKLRCPVCDGTGEISLDVQFLPDVNIPCPECKGSRYSKETCRIYYENKEKQKYSLPQLMEMDVNTALSACVGMKAVQQRLAVLENLGLGYLTLGEETPSLSGGEAQRLKLASEMGKGQSDSAFIFDEPQLIADSIDDFFNNLVAFPKIEEEQQTEIIEIEGVMPELSDCSASLTKEDIKNFEVELNVKIPAGMKNFYLKFNGGMPSPYCYQPQDEDLDRVEINAFFPIKERTNAFETIEVIAKDIWSRNLMPCNLLPFAMDSGGNYYALNLKNKKIYYYLTDEWDENASREYNFETNTRYIAQSFNYFINHFIEEEE